MVVANGIKQHLRVVGWSVGCYKWNDKQTRKTKRQQLRTPKGSVPCAQENDGVLSLKLIKGRKKREGGNNE